MRRADWFLLGMGLAVALAFVYPSPGARGGALHPEVLNKLGVALIFFLHGLTLPLRALASGTLLYRLHLAIQLTTFLVFPLLGAALLQITGALPAPLRVGLFFLCALPSTVSSSVALTAVARGNVAAALFNATLSSLLGIVLTPLWLGLVVGRVGKGLPLGDVVVDLCVWLLLPIVFGQLCRPLLGALATRHKARIGVLDRLTILLLVYTSFCDSAKERVWVEQSASALLVIAFACAALLVAVLALTSWLAGILRFPREDRVALVFCGSKKTLASGVPMANILFGGDPMMSLMLLPIMLYHPLQLVVCGVLAGRWGREFPGAPRSA